MAINTYELSTPSHFMGINKADNLQAARFVRGPNDYGDAVVKRGRSKKKKISPYLNGDRIQLLSRITEKRFVHRKNDIFSSFPLAANLYRASSVELKALKRSRHNKQKPKKSVLTLPNIPAPIPQSCTASDMNDAEYFNRSANKTKKRATIRNKVRDGRSKGQAQFEYYDRDADHLQDCSSTNLIKSYDGDGKRDYNRMSKNPNDLTAQDVWAVLRNINKFQFRASPRISEASVNAPKKRKSFVKRNGKLRNGRRLIETCRTEEIAYVANFEIQSKSSVSRTSSFDRVTVINRNDIQKKQIGEPACAALKNQVKMRINNKPKSLMPLPENNLCKFSPRTALRTLQHNNRLELLNKYRLHSTKTPQNAIKGDLDSTCTVRGSTDSSNCFRNSECEPLSTPTQGKTKTLKHPHEIQEIISHINDAKNVKQSSSAERLTTGVTRMVFNVPNLMFPDKVNLQKPKPRLVTTMPSAAAMPRLTITDIKRRLAQIKFPLVILGKEQLSSSIEVADYEPPQFRGLEDHIWPFMEHWAKKNSGSKKHTNSQQRRMLPMERITQNLRKVNNEISVVRKMKSSNVDVRRKLENKSRPLTDDEGAAQVPKKPKTMRQFKDKMLKLLYKKPSAQSIKPNTAAVEDVQNDVQPTAEKVDVSTETAAVSTELVVRSQVEPKRPDEFLYKFGRRPNGLPPVLSHKIPANRHPWARAKWASDFIDNVMNKINSGVYYCQEGKYSMNEDVCNKICLPDKVTCKLDVGTIIDFNDASVQTFDVSIISDQNKNIDYEKFDTSILENVNVANCETLLPIPGFDETLPDLEIKTLNINQIAVKHRLSNVMVQFDVAVPKKSNSSSQHHMTGKISASSSCIPLSVTESHTKIFKCNTTILNAVLPAELCTVIPHVMRNIFDSDTSLNVSSLTDSRATISEISELGTPTPSISTCQSAPNRLSAISNQWIHPHYVNQPMITNYDQWMHPQNYANSIFAPPKATEWPSACGTSWIANKTWVPPYGMPEYLPLHTPPILRKYLYGMYSPLGILWSKRRIISKVQVVCKIKLGLSENTMLHSLFTITVIPVFVYPLKMHMPLTDDEYVALSIRNAEKLAAVLPKKCEVIEKIPTKCTALQPYMGLQRRWIPSLSDFKTLLQNTWNYCKFNIHLSMPLSFIDPRRMTYIDDKITVNVVLGEERGVQKTSITVINLKIDSLYSRFDNILEKQTNAMTIHSNSTPLKSIEYSEDKTVHKKGEKSGPVKKSQEKLRKGCYVKLYKKCKSTSNISSEKLCTSLSKIANLDDFFQALGSAKAMASVFDGCAGRKVMTCVTELKNWIKDITPRQALLVLLLTNKKETPNLVRFRPVLLQGIAVNRITRASELDMEIEVIERENLKLTQYEGITYIAASVDNQDNLLEELCWIAKTTASDYQKPFDESSEKLLKSLLEKRKKLNPSYLRVMARYVGLGLLKTPASKNEKKHLV